ncbi:MAG: hypothetical protein NTX87_06635 [Planctomycetota bacterium]|nr:hypothetical protein [Planctomycetota bacterium]
MSKNLAIIGKARTVLVFGRDRAAKAIVSSVVARTRPGGRKRLVMRGQVTFDNPIFDHLSQNVLGVVDRIGQLLGVKRRSFEIEVVTPGVASMFELPVSISGFSADAPVFLALMSASLGMPVRQDVVTTGHIGSSDGELRPVKHIPAKLAAAAAEQNIHSFAYPSMDPDCSVSTLAPEEKAAVEEAVTAAKDRLRVTSVADVGHLLQQAIDEESLLLGALKGDFFGKEDLAGTCTGPLGHAVDLLVSDHARRFWRAIQATLSSSDAVRAKELLLERCRFHLRRKEYPSGFGGNLLPLVRSLPATVRRRKATFPLIPLRDCFRLAQFASPGDQADAEVLLSAVSGKRLGRHSGQEEDAAAATQDDTASKTVEVVDSHEAFYDEIESFYLAMLRQSAGCSVTASDMLAAEAHDLLSRAFADKGGVEAALAEALYGTSGGMRYILDVMTERFRAEQQAKWVDQVLKTALDALDWNARVAFMKAFLARLGPQLPAEFRSQPPERFARHYEVLLQEYVKSLNHLNRVLQRF